MVEKLFEKIDDNPGEYFGMLVEDYNKLNEKQTKSIIYLTYEDIQGNSKKFIKLDASTIEEMKDKVDTNSISRDDVIDLDGCDMDDIFGKNESLKEDKFVSRDKMSKKDRKELDSKKRNTWGNTNPATKVQPNKKVYDRKRDKKELDEDIEGINLTEEQLNNINTILYRIKDTSIRLKNDINDGTISKQEFSNVIRFFEYAAEYLKSYLK